MRSINDIRSANWQISLRGYGYVEDGFDDINQCIDIILNTRKGSDPFRPAFGSDIFKYIDQPVNTAAPRMVQAIIEAVGIWEPRIVIKSINYRLSNDKQYNIIFDILWVLVQNGQGGQLEFNLLRSFAEPPIIRPIPPKIDVLLSTEDGSYLTTEDDDFILVK